MELQRVRHTVVTQLQQLTEVILGQRKDRLPGKGKGLSPRRETVTSTVAGGELAARDRVFLEDTPRGTPCCYPCILETVFLYKGEVLAVIPGFICYMDLKVIWI